MKPHTFLPLLLILATACGKGTKQQDDELYSRHLQRKVKLTVINTPIPDDKSEINLLLLNDGQEAGKWGIQSITDSLYKAQSIQPVVIVAIHANDRVQEYGVAGRPDYEKRGSKADHYDAFVNNELYPYIKKKTGVRKFRSVVIAGASLGGLSAFDIGWNHADKIDKIGVFSGSFWWRDKNTSDSTYNDDLNRIVIGKLKASRKKPDQQYWFYTGGAEESSDRDGDGIIDVIDDTKDVIGMLHEKRGIPVSGISFIEVKNARHDWPYWRAALPGFMVWAFGR